MINAANDHRPAHPYNCRHCGAFNNRGCLCGCAASREAAGERVAPRTTVADLDAIELELPASRGALLSF